MAKFWKVRIAMRKMTIDQVPERWREETRKLLETEDTE
ncbi:CD1375 family protein [Blautia obeum]